MWAGCLSDRLQRPAKPKRALIHESFCSGTLAEQIAFEGLTIPFQTVSASDKKALARRFIASRAGAQHLFKSMADQVAGEGFCCIHGKVCRLVERPDLSVGGLPCQPFTKYRRRDGSSSKQAGTRDHPGFAVISGFHAYLESRKPRGFLVEETASMADANREGGSYLEEFVAEVAQLGYAVRAMKLGHRVWCEQPRERSQ